MKVDFGGNYENLVEILVNIEYSRIELVIIRVRVILNLGYFIFF